MESIDISVIVPIYNKEQYLEQCIDSILAQTKDKLEIVLVDDGSTDASGKIIDRYAAAWPQVVAVHQENRGLEGARITGFLQAKGAYIGWVDADDFVRSDMYQKLYDLAVNNGADLVYCDYAFYPHKVAAKAKWFQEYNGKRDGFFLDKNTSFCFKLFSRQLLADVDLPQLLDKYAEYSTIIPMMEAKRICFTREQLYVYRVGQASMSGGSFKGKVQHCQEGLETTRRLKEMIKGKSYEKELNTYFDYRYIFTLLLLTIVSAINDEKQVYQVTTAEMKRLHFRQNPYTKPLLDRHYGKLKSFVLRYFLTDSYTVARIITKLALN